MKVNVLIPTALLAVAISPLRAATIPVTSNADSGLGSLRDALASTANGDTINFSLITPAIITLTSGELLVTNSLIISGPGAANLAVNGNAASRVFHIASNMVVNISSLTISNGRVSGFEVDGDGAGIYNEQSALTISNVTLTGNSADYGYDGLGGGIFNASFSSCNASLLVINCALSNNLAGSGGGGIFNAVGAGTASVQIVNSMICGNSAYRYGGGPSGGGIANSATGGCAILQIVNCVIRDNLATDGYGGGVYNQGMFLGKTTAAMINSTVSSNSATYGGGGLQQQSRWQQRGYADTQRHSQRQLGLLWRGRIQHQCDRGGHKPSDRQ